jgi:hypothetical protein
MTKILSDVSLLWSAIFSPRCICRSEDSFGNARYTSGFMHKGEFHGDDTFEELQQAGFKDDSCLDRFLLVKTVRRPQRADGRTKAQGQT